MNPESLARWQGIACPVCGASAGGPCQDKDGRPGGIHLLRALAVEPNTPRSFVIVLCDDCRGRPADPYPGPGGGNLCPSCWNTREIRLLAAELRRAETGIV